MNLNFPYYNSNGIIQGKKGVQVYRHLDANERARIYEEERLREAARLDEKEYREELEEEKEEIKQRWIAIRAAIFILGAVAVAYVVFFL